MDFVTPDLCDQYSDTVSVVEPLFINYGQRCCFSGEIVTVKCFEDNSVVKEQVSVPGTDKVLVVDGGGSKRCALLGDQLALKASESGWSGLVIYGCVRDIDEIRKTDLGVQALGLHPRKSVKRGVGELNVVVTFAGVTFTPGCYLYADNNGIILSSKKLI